MVSLCMRDAILKGFFLQSPSQRFLGQLTKQRSIERDLPFSLPCLQGCRNNMISCVQQVSQHWPLCQSNLAEKLLGMRLDFLSVEHCYTSRRSLSESSSLPDKSSKREASSLFSLSLSSRALRSDSSSLIKKTDQAKFFHDVPKRSEPGSDKRRAIVINQGGVEDRRYGVGGGTLIAGYCKLQHYFVLTVKIRESFR